MYHLTLSATASFVNRAWPVTGRFGMTASDYSDVARKRLLQERTRRGNYLYRRTDRGSDCVAQSVPALSMSASSHRHSPTPVDWEATDQHS